MRKKEYKYHIGDVVNDTLKIVSKIRYGKENRKAYEVQSIYYPEAPTYIINEGKLNQGTRDAYITNQRIFEGNSLWGVLWVRPYLVDIEQAKTIAPKSGKKIILKCPDCSRDRYMRPSDLLKQGFNCPFCSKGTSYPELFMMAYLDMKGIKYEYQKTFKDFTNRRFDFYIRDIGVLELHGIQHYKDKGHWDYNNTIKSDKDKKEYCYNSNIKYIEIDSRRSSYNYLKENINQCKHLPNIECFEEEQLLYNIEKNKRYPSKDIIVLYKEGMSTTFIGEKYNLNHATIGNILRKNNIKIRDSRESSKNNKRVKCLNNGMVFNSITEAVAWCGLKSKSSISSACKGIRNTAGKHPETKEKLYWEYFIN